MARISTWAAPLSSCRRAAASAVLILLTTAGSAGAAVTTNVWTSSGPYSAVVNQVGFTSDESAIVAGTNGGGIFRSVNNGTNWGTANTGLSSSAVITALATLDTNHFAGSNGSGVYISADAVTWLPASTGLPPNSNISSLSVNGTDLYASVNGGGVFKSSDNGSTWTAINDADHDGSLYLPTANIRAITVIPTTPATVLAGANSAGVFYSTDDGETWHGTTGFPAGTTVQAVACESTTVCYAGTKGVGVYKSIDGGQTWSAPANNGLPVNATVNAFKLRGAASVYALTDEGIFQSGDKGANWASLNTGLGTSSCYSLTWATGNPAIMYLATSGGVYKTEDNGATWTGASTGLRFMTDIKATAIDPANATYIYAGGSGSGAFKSTNSGTSWSIANSGLGSSIVNTLLPRPAALYAGTSNGVFRSTDGAATWTAVNTSLPAVDVRALGFDSLTSTIYAGTSNGIFKTPEGLINWTATTTPGNPDIRDLAIDTSVSPAAIYAGTAGSGVYMSTDGGDNWSAVNTGLTSTTINAVGTGLNSGTAFAATATGLFKSTNYGTSWINTANSFSVPDVRSILINTASALVIAGTNTGGAYLSSNGGDSWLAFNNGLPADPVVQALSLDPGTPKRLYAGLEGQGVAAISLSPTILAREVLGVMPPDPTTTLDYGTRILVKDPPLTKTVRMDNNGTLPLKISAIDGLSAPFRLSPGSENPCSGVPVVYPITIPPLTSCSMDVVFEPVDDAIYSATMSILSNDVNAGNTQITLQGKAIELTAAITSPASGAYLYGTTATIQGTATASGTTLQTIEVSTNGGTTWTAATGTTDWTYTWTLPTDGAYGIKARAKDVAGYYSTAASIIVKVNNVLPVSAITAPANNAKLTGGVRTITGTAADIGADVKQVDVSTDGGVTWSTATGTNNWAFSWTPVTSGTYIIQSRATDNDNKVQAQPFPSVTVVVDTLPPTTTITAPVNNAILSGTSATIRGTANDTGGSGLNNTELFIDGVPATVTGALWSYTWTYPANTYHTYSIYTQASDLAGNVEVLAPGAGITVIVDNIAPTSTINALPTYITGTGYTFTGDAADTGVGIAKVQVSINSGPWADATGTTAWSYAWTVPADGTYSLAVRAIDGAGNIQAVAATATPVVNNGPPLVAIAAPADNASIKTPSFTITGTAADPGAGIKRVEVSIDGGGWNTATFNGVTGTWSYVWTIPPQEKKYTIQAKATDNNNDTSTTPLITVTYDVTAPVSTIVVPAANALLNGNAYTITGTALDPVSPAGERAGLQTVQVSFDGGTVWYPATSSDGWATWSYNWILPLTETHLTIKSRAIDKAGNIQAAPFAAAVNVYQVPPTSVITSPAHDAFLNGASRTITGTATDLGLGIDFVEISTDGGSTWNLATGAESWSYTWTLPADGVYTILVRATDLVGYVQAAPTSISVTVDNTLPDTSIDGMPLLYSNTASPAFTFSATEPATFQCKLDSGAYTACTSPFTYTGVPDGSHTFTVRAIDRAGNIDASPATYTWTVDTVAPTVGSPSPADGATRISVTSPVTVTFSEAMDPATITTSTFRLDNGTTGTVSYNPATKVATFSAVPRLKYATTYTATVTAGAKDLAGNPLAAPLTWTFDTDPDGDINLDGVVDIADAVACLRAVVRHTTLSSNQIRHADVAPLNGGKPKPNGSVDIGDAVVILERVAGISLW